MCMVWHPRCRQAAPGLLQTTMQISGQLEWPTMSNMQNDCFGMNGLLWQYHHDHILKGRFFGRVDVCECAWCDCFFRCCMFCGWGGHRRWASRPRGPSGFKLLFYATMGLANSRFRRDMLFVLAPHANVRKQNLDSRNESETRTIFTCQIRGSCFLRDRACCY
mgnify:FL=1